MDAEAIKAARLAANIDPAPGPLAEALLPTPICLPEELAELGFEIRPVVAADEVLLRKIGSPLIAEWAEAQKPDGERQAVDWPAEDVWGLFFLWTRPYREAAALAARGRDEYLAGAMAATAERLSIGVLKLAPAILGALRENLERSAATVVVYKPKPAEGEQVFTMPAMRRQTG
jgi:hypothetical protein